MCVFLYLPLPLPPLIVLSHSAAVQQWVSLTDSLLFLAHQCVECRQCLVPRVSGHRLRDEERFGYIIDRLHRFVDDGDAIQMKPFHFHRCHRHILLLLSFDSQGNSSSLCNTFADSAMSEFVTARSSLVLHPLLLQCILDMLLNCAGEHLKLLG